jgi:hypothetical protein
MAIVLKITPTRFRASGSKLDSQRRYIRKVSSGEDLRFVNGQNMDVSGGGLRYVQPTGTAVDDSEYDGSFIGTTGTRIKV